MNQNEFNEMLKIAIDGGALDGDSFKSKYTGEEIEAYLTKMKNSPAGSTTMDAEVIDIRTGYDGTVYNTAGEAVRTVGAKAAEAHAAAGEAKTAVDGKASKPTYAEAIMLASGWSGNKYSFEAEYSSEAYNISIEVAPTATVEQFEAFGEAMICGSATDNSATALNDAPTIDIPVIVKAVRK
jgi:hypothetical protein